jgi:hypothetical protein
MANTTFSGPVISKNGFINTGPGNIKTLNTSTALTVADHAGRIVINNSAGAVTFTLPALNATANAEVAGPTDYNNLNNLDVMIGGAKFIDDTSDNMVGFETVAASDTITLNGSTTGGVTYSKITCTAISSTQWKVNVDTGCTGTPATPFSAAV